MIFRGKVFIEMVFVAKGNFKVILFYIRLERKVFVARNNVFFKKEFLKSEKSGKKVCLEEV